jgi:uncharacterized membrane protein YdjX (TVP38/TMEM64 family)
MLPTRPETPPETPAAATDPVPDPRLDDPAADRPDAAAVIAPAAPAGRRSLAVAVATVGLAALVLVGLGAVVLAVADGRLDLSAAAIEAAIRDLGPWAAAGSIGAMVLHSFVPLPAEVIAVANGMVFGPLLGIALTWAGAMAGAVVAFGLARRFGRPLVVRVVPARHWHRIDGWTATESAGALLLARLVPVISFNLINYAAGLTGVRFGTFLWTTGLGILPVTILCVVAGEVLIAAPVWAWLAVAAVLAAVWLSARRLRRGDRRAGRGAAGPG